ncbi:34808_t:CDS:2, partial [Gigaspora margarita]
FELGHFDYGIEEQLVQKTSSKQMVVDSETIIKNLPKTPIELDSYRTQNESKKEDSILKKSETTCLRIQKLLKPLTIHKKENYIINSTLMKIDPNRVKIEIESDKAHAKVSSSQEVLQINILLQKILKKLEIVENNQSVFLVTDKSNPSIRSLAHPSNSTLVEIKNHSKS